MNLEAKVLMAVEKYLQRVVDMHADDVARMPKIYDTPRFNARADEAANILRFIKTCKNIWGLSDNEVENETK